MFSCACFFVWIIVLSLNYQAGMLIGYIFGIILGAVLAMAAIFCFCALLFVAIDKIWCTDT